MLKIGYLCIVVQRQIVDIPMETYCAPLIALMASLPYNKEAEIYVFQTDLIHPKLINDKRDDCNFDIVFFSFLDGVGWGGGGEGKAFPVLPLMVLTFHTLFDLLEY